jgi:hypothetical protein
MATPIKSNIHIIFHHILSETTEKDQLGSLDPSAWHWLLTNHSRSVKICPFWAAHEQKQGGVRSLHPRSSPSRGSCVVWSMTIANANASRYRSAGFLSSLMWVFSRFWTFIDWNDSFWNLALICCSAMSGSFLNDCSYFQSNGSSFSNDIELFYAHWKYDQSLHKSDWPESCSLNAYNCWPRKFHLVERYCLHRCFVMSQLLARFVWLFDEQRIHHLNSLFDLSIDGWTDQKLLILLLKTLGEVYDKTKNSRRFVISCQSEEDEIGNLTELLGSQRWLIFFRPTSRFHDFCPTWSLSFPLPFPSFCRFFSSLTNPL